MQQLRVPIFRLSCAWSGIPQFATVLAQICARSSCCLAALCHQIDAQCLQLATEQDPFLGLVYCSLLNLPWFSESLQFEALIKLA